MKCLSLVLGILFVGCTTIEEFQAPEPVVIENIEETFDNREIIVLREPQYIFLPEVSFDSDLNQQSFDNELDQIDSNIDSSTVRPGGQSWDESVLEYDYIEGRIYHIYTTPIRITNIYLSPGEVLQGDLILGDSSSWLFWFGTSGGERNPINHVYIKPTEVNLQTSLIINTNLRSYNTVITSTPDTHMVGVRWRYPLEEIQGASISGVYESEEDIPDPAVDLSSLSFDYRIEYPVGQQVQWKPVSVYDNGIKTYIVLPPTALNHELPGFSLGITGIDREITNYRVIDNIYEVDKLIEVAELRIEEQWIRIEKRRSQG